MTAVDVDALDKLREAATTGPWQYDREVSAVVWDSDPNYPEILARSAVDADAALIVAAVNALPELLAEVRRGRALREAVEGLAKSYAAGGWVGTDVADSLRAVLAAVDGEQ